MKHDPIMSTGPARAFVLFRSGGRSFDLLNPRFDCWTDEGPRAQPGAHQPMGRRYAVGRGAFSPVAPKAQSAPTWRPLSHERALAGLRGADARQDPLRDRRDVGSDARASRCARVSCLHDASEGLLGWDPIGPLKDHLGEPFRQLEQRLQALVGERYASCRPGGTPAAYRRHKVGRSLSPLPLKPATSSAGAARTCAMRSASSR